MSEARIRNQAYASWTLLLAAVWAGVTTGGLAGSLLARFFLEGFTLPVYNLLAALVGGLWVWVVGRRPSWRGALAGGAASAGSMALAQYFHIIAMRAYTMPVMSAMTKAVDSWKAASWLYWVLIGFGIYVGAHLGFHGRDTSMTPLEREPDDEERIP